VKIIINNESGLSDEEAILRVLSIVQAGKVSTSAAGPQYCFASSFNDCCVWVAKRKGSETQKFLITKS
jgi:hypothetical protein